MSACHICGRHHELPEERLRAEVERLRMEFRRIEECIDVERARVLAEVRRMVEKWGRDAEEPVLRDVLLALLEKL